MAGVFRSCVKYEEEGRQLKGLRVPALMMDDSIVSSEADPASPPPEAAMDTSEANEDSCGGGDAMIRNDTDPNLCSPEQLGEIEINNDFDDLHQVR